MKLSKSNLWQVVLFFAIATSACAEDAGSWLHEPPGSDLESISRLQPISPVSVYEVVPTKTTTALVWHLTKKTHADIGCNDANFLTGGHFTCEAGKHPVLVRAVYANGGTGNFIIHYKESSGALYIFHGSLGERGAVENVPLVINLPSDPRIIYSWVGSAK